MGLRQTAKAVGRWAGSCTAPHRHTPRTDFVGDLLHLFGDLVGRASAPLLEAIRTSAMRLIEEEVGAFYGIARSSVAALRSEFVYR